MRGAIWQILAQSRVHRPELADVGIEPQPGIDPNDLYQQLCAVPDAPCENDIKRDVHRTFPKLVLFRDRHGLGQRGLLRVLRAYSVYDTEVGYCQGMGFLAGLLMVYMSEEDAFYMLVALLDRYSMSGLFRPNLPLLNKYFFQLQRLIEMHFPLLHEHLAKNGVEPTMYASQWFMTVCIYNFPFSSIVRVWDMFLAEGVKVIFRVALALLS